MEREMTAPMSLEGREAPVFGGVREKERERELHRVFWSGLRREKGE